MEKDEEFKGEGNSYDFGARMYDARIGRWMSVDPLAANYAGVSSYGFGLNNPVLFIDPDGAKVIAKTQEAQKIIRMSLTPQESKYLKFNRKGVVKRRKLNRGMRRMNNEGGNYIALQTLATEKEIHEVIVSNHHEANYRDNGTTETYDIDLSLVRYESDFEVMWKLTLGQYLERGESIDKSEFERDNPDLSKESTAVGHVGQTLHPDDGQEGLSSKSGNHEVIVSDKLNDEDKVRILAHELYGHDYFEAIGKDSHHGAFDPSSKEYNHELEGQIKKRMNEASENYNEHQNQQE
jgi:RHS repeat-associated protein